MDNSNIVRAVPIHEGMKIFMTSEESFLDANKKLNDYGFITSCDERRWSIYIVSAPYEYNETIYRIK